MFGGIGISTRQAADALIDGLSKREGLSAIAGNLLNEAIGGGTFVNSVLFYIIDEQTGTEIQLPVNPEKITLKWSRKIETVNILNLGEVDFTTGDKLMGISFSSFFPTAYVPAFCTTADLPTPESANAIMTAWKSRFNEPKKGLKDPVRLIITGAQEINMLVIMTEYENDEHGGEPGDIYYKVSFREWKELFVRTESEEKPGSRTDMKARPKLVKVPSGLDAFSGPEALWKIAKQHYGRGESWQGIFGEAAVEGLAGKKGVRLP